MSSNPDVRVIQDPHEARAHMAVLISEALLKECQELMGKNKPAVPPPKKRTRRQRSLENSAGTSRHEKCQRTQPSTSSSQARRRDHGGEGELHMSAPELSSLETRLQELRGTITAVQVPEAPVSAWAQRQLQSDGRRKIARPKLFDAKLSAERVGSQKCDRCCSVEAVIRCLECVPQNMEFLCATCDVEAHKRNIFHDREAFFNGFLEPIPPTSTVVMDDNGNPHFCEQTCQLPVCIPKSVCGCTSDLIVTTWKHASVVTINGRYEVCLPRASCPACCAEWTPGVKDLLVYRYWPSTISCQTLYKFDVFTSYENMKVTAPALSRQAFLKMLEHRSVNAGRTGSICADTFQQSFFEYCFCQNQEEDLCQVDHFVCPACSPDMLAVCCDGNRKQYRFSKSKGTETPSLYDGLFLAKDEEVATFVNLVRSNTKNGNEKAVCGSATFTAGREASRKSGAHIDEEGIQVAVCRHGFLLRGLNHQRGEIFAYPMFLQKEMLQKANVNFFCMDVTCRYWPYLNRMAEGIPELLPLTKMRPFLSVMHAKAHTAKCEVRWGGRNQEGAGNTVGEEVEQVNSFLSRAALVTKYMTKAGRVNMLTQQAMGWNKRKRDNLDAALTRRYIKVTKRVKEETASLCSRKAEHNLSEETIQQWLCDIKEWALTDRGYAAGGTEDLRADIESITVSLLRKRQDLYRLHDSNKVRHRKKKKIAELKKKLREKVSEYNRKVEDDPIDEELACSLTEGYVLPWERHEEGNFRLKRSIFDHVMLVRRLEEEQSILVKEMSQHIMYLLKDIQEVEGVKRQTMESIKNSYFMDLSEDASFGLISVLNRRLHTLRGQHKTAVHAYSRIAALDWDGLSIPEDIEDCEDNGFTSPDSEDDDV